MPVPPLPTPAGRSSLQGQSKSNRKDLQGQRDWMSTSEVMPVSTCLSDSPLNIELPEMVLIWYQEVTNTCLRAQDSASTQLFISRDPHWEFICVFSFRKQIGFQSSGFSRGQTSGNIKQCRKTTLSQFTIIRDMKRNQG